MHRSLAKKYMFDMFQCYDEKTIEDMTDEMEMMSNPNLVEKRKEMKEQKSGGPVCIHHHHVTYQIIFVTSPRLSCQVHGYDPAKSQVISVLEEHNQVKTHRHIF